MAVVDDVHARALHQVRGEADAASQVPNWDWRGLNHVHVQIKVARLMQLA
jgi:hypothetical protein